MPKVKENDIKIYINGTHITLKGYKTPDGCQ